MRALLRFRLRFAFLIVTLLAVGLAILAYCRSRDRYYQELDVRFTNAISMSIDDARPSAALLQLDEARTVYHEAQAAFPDSHLTGNMRWKINFVEKTIFEQEYALAHPDEIAD